MVGDGLLSSNGDKIADSQRLGGSTEPLEEGWTYCRNGSQKGLADRDFGTWSS